MELSTGELLTYSTVRIECQLNNHKTTTGTGFFFCFNLDEGGLEVIVTNKHVIKDSQEGKLCINIQDENGMPKLDNFVDVKIEKFEDAWISHPDKNVDLCILPLSHIRNRLRQDNKKPFWVSLDYELVADDVFLKELDAFEEIIMIGYPNDIWDDTNNMPIARRGITATHPGLNFKGKHEFMIDAACFPGSSGSPVYLYNIGNYKKKNTNAIILGSRVKLLGILYAGPQHIVAGEIQLVPITQQKPISIAGIPNNLGMVIKSYMLKDFEQILQQKLKSQGKIQ